MTGRALLHFVASHPLSSIAAASQNKHFTVLQQRNIIGTLYFEKPGCDLWDEVCETVGPLMWMRGEVQALVAGEMRAKAKLLADHGVVPEQLVERPDVLFFMSPQQLRFRIKRLRWAGSERITTHLLKVVNKNKSVKASSKIVQEYFAVLGDHPSHMHFLAQQLECSVRDIYESQKTYPRLLGTKDLGLVSQKIQLLKEYGITSKEILKMPKILEKSLDLIRTRIELMKEKGFKYFYLTYLVQGEPAFTRLVEKGPGLAPKRRQYLNEEELLTTVAGLLALDRGELERHCRSARAQRDLKANFTANPDILLPKLHVLREAGVTGWELVNHSYILRYSLPKLQSVLDALNAQHGSLDGLDLLQVVGALKGAPVRKSRRSEVLGVLREVTGASEDTVATVADMARTLTPSPPSPGAPPTSLRSRCAASMEVLAGAGYGGAELQTYCLLPLFPPAVLERHLAGLWSRPEMQLYTRWRGQDHKTLNALAYFLERDVLPS